jgi:hypothetical protein
MQPSRGAVESSGGSGIPQGPDPATSGEVEGPDGSRPIPWLGSALLVAAPFLLLFLFALLDRLIR